jgi:ABC-type molybdate transport system substrate-binding protein
MMALLLTGAPGMAAEINVMSGGAPKEALAILIPRFEKLTGHHVKITCAVIAALQQKLTPGETPDERSSGGSGCYWEALAIR